MYKETKRLAKALEDISSRDHAIATAQHNGCTHLPKLEFFKLGKIVDPLQLLAEANEKLAAETANRIACGKPCCAMQPYGRNRTPLGVAECITIQIRDRAKEGSK